MTIGSAFIEDSKDSTDRGLVKKLIDAVVIGLLGWLCFSMQQVQIDVAVMKNQAAQFGDPAERWTQQEHDAYSALVTKELDEINKRLRDVENKVN